MRMQQIEAEEERVRLEIEKETIAKNLKRQSELKEQQVLKEQE